MAKYFSFPRYIGHNPWLDALRALAVTLVLLRHGIREQPAQSGPDSFLSNLGYNGWIGVDLFFVLSGYLIAGILIRRLKRGGAIFNWRYFEDRILRIVPAYYAVLILCVVGFFPGLAFERADLGTRVAYHMVFLHDYLGSDINVVFWSLGVEEKFYILAPLAILVLIKARTFPVQLAICVLLLAISPMARGQDFLTLANELDYQMFFEKLRSPFHMSLEGFVLGIIVALVQMHGWLVSGRVAKFGLLLSFAGLIIWIGSHEFLASLTIMDAVFQPLLLSLLFGLMVFFGVSLAQNPMPFEPLMRVQARLSYTLYLVHFPLVPMALQLNSSEGLWTYWGIFLSITYLITLFLHFFVEKPFLLLKHKRAKKHKLDANLKTTDLT